MMDATHSSISISCRCEGSMSGVISDISAKRQSGRPCRLRRFRAPEFERDDAVVSRSLESVAIMKQAHV